ncbi:MAG TPA: hypothetical protein VFQ38_15050 [Longimicrobiales bacterium]|nr:hypothetical protein [Longimicrobiales bacterium]
MPTLYVANNPTCTAAGCRTLEIRAFVWAFRVPQPPWGYEVIGEMHGRTACFTFPASWTFRVIGLRDTTADAPADTTTLTWTPDSASGISVVAIDSAMFHGKEGLEETIRGRTETFVPARAQGWNTTLSGGLDSTAAVAATPCGS